MPKHDANSSEADKKQHLCFRGRHVRSGGTKKKKNTAKVQAIPTVTLKNRSHLVRATKLAIVEHNEKLTILHVTRLSSIERHRMPRLDAQPR